MKHSNSHKVLTAVLLLTAFFLIPAASFARTVTFNNKATVTGNNILLKDLVKFDHYDEFSTALGSQYITTAGEAGSTITLQTRDIIQYLSSSLTLPPDLVWAGAESIIIYRDAILIGPEKIDKLISDFIKQNKHRLPDAEISFKIQNYPLPFSLPKGTMTCDIIPSNPKIVGSTAFTLIFKINGHVEENMMIRGDLSVLSEVTVTKVPLRRGTVIQYEHLATEMRDISKAQSPVFNMDDLIGKRMLTNLRADDILELTDVDSPPVIKKGELVKIIVNSGGLHLTASGVAKSDGKLNEMIRVRNTSSNKLVHCRVSGPGEVEVNI